MSSPNRAGDAIAIVGDVLAALNHLQIEHMLTGSLASNVYGRPRATADADIVVVMSSERVNDLALALAPRLTLDRQASFETVTLSLRWRFFSSRSTFVVELFERADHPFDRERFNRRVSIDFAGVATWVATAEDVVIQKLRWGARAKRAKDIDDARDVIRVSGAGLDWTYVQRWCDEFGTRAMLDSIRGADAV